MEPLPSDVARVVLGYLSDTCPDVAEQFLAASPDLGEVRRMKPHARRPYRPSLVDLLTEHATACSLVEDVDSAVKWLGAPNFNGDFIYKLRRLLAVIVGAQNGAAGQPSGSADAASRQPEKTGGGRRVSPGREAATAGQWAVDPESMDDSDWDEAAPAVGGDCADTPAREAAVGDSPDRRESACDSPTLEIDTDSPADHDVEDSEARPDADTALQTRLTAVDAGRTQEDPAMETSAGETGEHVPGGDNSSGCSGDGALGGGGGGGGGCVGGDDRRATPKGGSNRRKSRPPRRSDPEKLAAALAGRRTGSQPGWIFGQVRHCPPSGRAVAAPVVPELNHQGQQRPERSEPEPLFEHDHDVTTFADQPAAESTSSPAETDLPESLSVHPSDLRASSPARPSTMPAGLAASYALPASSPTSPSTMPAGLAARSALPASSPTSPSTMPAGLAARSALPASSPTSPSTMPAGLAARSALPASSPTSPSTMPAGLAARSALPASSPTSPSTMPAGLAARSALPASSPTSPSTMPAGLAARSPAVPADISSRPSLPSCPPVVPVRASVLPACPAAPLLSAVGHRSARKMSVPRRRLLSQCGTAKVRPAAHRSRSPLSRRPAGSDGSQESPARQHRASESPVKEARVIESSAEADRVPEPPRVPELPSNRDRATESSAKGVGSSELPVDRVKVTESPAGGGRTAADRPPWPSSDVDCEALRSSTPFSPTPGGASVRSPSPEPTGGCQPTPGGASVRSPSPEPTGGCQSPAPDVDSSPGSSPATSIASSAQSSPPDADSSIASSPPGSICSGVRPLPPGDFAVGASPTPSQLSGRSSQLSGRSSQLSERSTPSGERSLHICLTPQSGKTPSLRGSLRAGETPTSVRQSARRNMLTGRGSSAYRRVSAPRRRLLADLRRRSESPQLPLDLSHHPAQSTPSASTAAARRVSGDSSAGEPPSGASPAAGLRRTPRRTARLAGPLASSDLTNRPAPEEQSRGAAEKRPLSPTADRSPSPPVQTATTPSDGNNKSLLKSINILSFLSRIHSVGTS